MFRDTRAICEMKIDTNDELTTVPLLLHGSPRVLMLTRIWRVSLKRLSSVAGNGPGHYAIFVWMLCIELLGNGIGYIFLSYT